LPESMAGMHFADFLSLLCR